MAQEVQRKRLVRDHGTEAMDAKIKFEPVAADHAGLSRVSFEPEGLDSVFDEPAHEVCSFTAPNVEYRLRKVLERKPQHLELELRRILTARRALTRPRELGDEALEQATLERQDRIERRNEGVVVLSAREERAKLAEHTLVDSFEAPGSLLVDHQKLLAAKQKPLYLVDECARRL